MQVVDVAEVHKGAEVVRHIQLFLLLCQFDHLLDKLIDRRLLGTDAVLQVATLLVEHFQGVLYLFLALLGRNCRFEVKAFVGVNADTAGASVGRYL